MFLAFLKLRKQDKDIKRPYRVPVSGFMEKVAAIVPFVILIAGVLFTIFGDFSLEYLADNKPLIAGVVLSFVIEEILVARIKKEKPKKELVEE
jgi:amino acid transporter